MDLLSCCSADSCDQNSCGRSGIARIHAFAGGLALLVLFLGQPAFADYTILQSDQFTLTGNFMAGLYGVTTDNPNFGAGVINQKGDFHHNVSNSEYFVKPGVKFTWRLPDAGEVYGGLDAVAVGQTGDGDPGGFTSGDNHVVHFDSAFGGWRNKLVDVSFGRQPFIVGDQFLIGYNGNFNTERDANYWVFPFKAFSNSAIVRLNGEPVRSDFFWLRSDIDQGNTELAGVNTEYLLGENRGKLGAMFAKVVGENANFPSPRQGMEVYDVRANSVSLPTVPNLTLHSELTFERGSDNHSGGVSYDAYSWYVEGDYKFAHMRWTPEFGYRYGFWSGDNNASDHVRKGYDPLFYYFDYLGRTWGTWYQGEIGGEYLLFNTNQVTQMVKAIVHPTQTVSLWALYFHHELDKKNYFGTPVTSTDFLDEFNFVTEWIPNPHWYVAGVLGYGLPGQAAKEVFGNDKNYGLLQGYVLYTF